MRPDPASTSGAPLMPAEPAGPLRPTLLVGGTAFRFGDGVGTAMERAVATEVPVQMLFADIPFGIMMATPADLEDFAYGFSLTEGVIGAPSEIRGVSVEPEDGAVRLRIDIVGARLQAHLARKRAMTGRTSCGLCGIDDLSALPRASCPSGSAPRIALGAIERALASLDDLQLLNAATRAVHGAAWAGFDGEIRMVREDVGRHNALDKLIGACLRTGMHPGDGFVLVTSRASFEMVEKTATFGARTMVAISAPTALAIARARDLDVTLACIARRDGMTVFHGAERITSGP